MLRRIEYDRYGPAQEMHLSELTLVAPGAGQIRITVRAASANPVDWKIRNGELKLMTGRRFPKGMGQDFAGVVDMVGPDVTGLQIGAEVFGAMDLKEAGSFSSSIVTSRENVAIKPANLSFEQASTLATVGKTAWGAIVDIGRVQRGNRVLVNGCLGGVGRSAVQVATSMGAEVTGVCRVAGLDEARQSGVSNAIDSARLDAANLSGTFDLVLDAVGNLTTTQCSRLLKAGGTALHVNGGPGKILRILLAPGNKFVSVKTTSDILQKVGHLASSGQLDLPIGRTVDLDEAIAAVAGLENSGLPKGKLVIVPRIA